jgi:hypothetical protein
VTIQTSWFILQLISRSIQGLPIIKLEITTLAFAVLNFVTYTLWWNKPHKVERAVSVRKPKKGTTPRSAPNTLSVKELEEESIKGEVPRRVWRGKRNASFRAASTVSTVPSMSWVAVRRFRTVGAIWDAVTWIFDHVWRKIWFTLRRVFVMLYAMSIRPFLDIIMEVDDWKYLQEVDAVPTFYHGHLIPDNNKEALRASVRYHIAVATIFGAQAIHCIAWSIRFPTVAEKNL